MTLGRAALVAAISVVLGATAASTAPREQPSPERPSVVMILLDTTRADRFSSWGSGLDTTPAMDALAAGGAQFARHFANSHATRPSLPQIMSGRYFHPSVLRPFQPDSHPRDYPFLLPDPSARLLTDLVREAGYELLGVSAHPWVDPTSRMGRAFHRLEYRSAPSGRGHADADEIVDRAIALWDGRSRGRPTFLYVHLLDLHTPRWLPGEAPEFLAVDVPWQARFGPDGEPTFGAERRRWDFTDARDFTADDRAVYRAVYDTLLRYTDGQLARLLEHVRRDDPELGRTMVVVLADHGEQLGEEGHLKHGDSLHDAVQHTPLIVAGAGVLPGQRIEAFSENIDVAPTVASLAGIDVPPGTFDGRALLGSDGTLCAGCEKQPAVFYAWSGYLAVRTSRWLLRVDPPGAPLARCRAGETTLWRVDDAGGRRIVRDERRTATLRRKIERRLAGKARRLEEGLREQPREPFFVPVEQWRLQDPQQISCVPIDGGIEAEALTRPGWLLVREGVVVAEPPAAALSVTVTVPDGAYDVAAGVRPLGWLWRMPGLFFRAREALHGADAESFVDLGRLVASHRRLTLRIPADVATNQRVVNLRLTPVGAGTKDAPAIDAEHHERLRTLGYVE
jgi:arylsulfatase A-like enzyme